MKPPVEFAGPIRPVRGPEAKITGAIVQLKSRLQTRYESCLPGKSGQIRQIIHAAEDAAWGTGFPHLFLPELADEGIARLVATQPIAFAEREAASACLACAA